MKEEALTREKTVYLPVSDPVDVATQDEHVVHIPTPLEKNIDENYKFISKNPVFRFFSTVFKAIALALMHILCKVLFDLKIEGRENIADLKKKGYVTVCNHVNFLDCGMIACATGRLDTVFTVLKSNFGIPVVRKIIKGLGATPIPTSPRAFSAFSQAIGDHLGSGHVVHFYPEGILYPYYNGVRKFRRGAFAAAVNSNVPVVPLVINYRKVTGIESLFKRKPFATITVLKPIYPAECEDKKGESIRVMEAARNEMRANFS